MKILTKKTIYVFLKPSGNGEYFFIRTHVESLEEHFVWFIGRENHLGFVSSVGGGLSENTQKELEAEYQLQLQADSNDIK